MSTAETTMQQPEEFSTETIAVNKEDLVEILKSAVQDTVANVKQEAQATLNEVKDISKEIKSALKINEMFIDPNDTAGSVNLNTYTNAKNQTMQYSSAKALSEDGRFEILTDLFLKKELGKQDMKKFQEYEEGCNKYKKDLETKSINIQNLGTSTIPLPNVNVIKSDYSELDMKMGIMDLIKKVPCQSAAQNISIKYEEYPDEAVTKQVYGLESTTSSQNAVQPSTMREIRKGLTSRMFSSIVISEDMIHRYPDMLDTFRNLISNKVTTDLRRDVEVRVAQDLMKKAKPGRKIIEVTNANKLDYNAWKTEIADYITKPGVSLSGFDKTEYLNLLFDNYAMSHTVNKLNVLTKVSVADQISLSMKQKLYQTDVEGQRFSGISMGKQSGFKMRMPSFIDPDASVEAYRFREIEGSDYYDMVAGDFSEVEYHSYNPFGGDVSTSVSFSMESVFEANKNQKSYYFRFITYDYISTDLGRKKVFLELNP